MCVSPITVHIKRIDAVNGYARTGYTVPCGKCWQCRLNKQNSYFVRAFYQWLMTKHYKGYSSFLTCTYAPEYLPHTKYYKIPIFRKTDVQKYIKRVRKRVALLVAKNQNISVADAQKKVANVLSYFVVSENGEKSGRPHYHIIWHCHYPIISYFAFAKIIKDAWQLGFTRLGDNFGLINSESGIKYVCKYIGKTITQDSRYNDIIGNLNYVLNAKSIEYSGDSQFKKYTFKVACSPEKTKHDLQEFIDNKPFLLLSKNYGMFAFSSDCSPCYKLSLDSLKNNLLTINKNDYQIPQYFRRKMCYDVRQVLDNNCDFKVQYTINDNGLKIHSQTFDKLVRSHYDRLVSTLSPEFLNETTVTRLNKRFNLDFTASALRSSLYGIVTNKYFVDYSYCYRHYDYLVNKFYSVPQNTTNIYDVSQFFDLFSSSSSDAITSSNYDCYLGYIRDVADTVCWYNTNFPQFTNVVKMIDYLRNIYGRDTQQKQNFIDKMSFSRKSALGIAL